jgi:excisionase family DNA binding protein
VTETPRFFDIPAAAVYANSIGLTGVTAYTIRMAINSGRLAHIKEGRKFYVSKLAVDAWLAKAERRGRA